MDTQTQIDRLIELAIIQRSELKQLVEQLPQLREHLNAEVEKVFDETEPQLRAELEEWTTKQTADKTAALGVALEAKIADLAKSLEVSTQARYNAIIAEREENARLAAQAEAKIAEHAASLPSAVKDIVTAELARFPRAGEIDQLRKEFAEPRGLNPRGKWQAGESYNKLDLVTINGDSYTSNTDGNRTRPSRSSADWTLVAARGTGGGGGPTSLSELTTVPSDGDVLIGSGTSWVTSNLTAGAGISITVGPGAITISATDGDITLDDGTAASPSLHFTNDPDTGIYRPAANTLGISVSGTQVAYFDENGLTVPSAGVVAGGSIHAGNGNANNPSLSFDGDQDTGFFRHQPNEIGIALGGTQYATLTSTTFSITPVVTMASSLRVNGTTDSSSKDTGAIVTEGGLGVEKSATIGGNLTVSGTGTSSVAGPWKIKPATNTSQLILEQNNATANWNIFCDSTTGGLSFIRNTSGTTYFSIIASSNATIGIDTTISGDLSVNNVKPAAGYSVDWGFGTSIKRVISDGRLQLNSQNGAYEFTGTGAATFAGNLTVSGTGGITASASFVPITALGTSGSSGSFVSDGHLNDLQGNTSQHFLIKRAKSTTTQSRWAFQLQGGENPGDSPVGGSELVFAYSTAATGTFTNALSLTRTGNATIAGNLTVSGGTISSGTATLTLKSTSNTVVLQSAGTTALTLDSSQNATFAGTVTVSKASAGLDTSLTVNNTDSASNSTSSLILTSVAGSWTIQNNRSGGHLYFKDPATSATQLQINNSTGLATFAGSIAIGNTVNTVSPTSPNRTITMVIGGTTYYIHAKTTND